MFNKVILSVVGSALVLAMSWQAEQAFALKADQQTQVSDTAEKWSQSYAALGVFQKEWDLTLISAQDVPDLTLLTSKVDIQPLQWPEPGHLSVRTAEVVPAINAHKVCLDGRGGLQFSAPSVQVAFETIERFGRRHDLSFDGVRVAVSAASGNPTVQFDEFCVFLRG